jgi:FkbM family methyltransferase
MGGLRSAIVSRLPGPVVTRLRAVKGSVARRHWVDEAEIIASLASTRLESSNSVLVDVGAHCGTVTTLFLEMGWCVVAYEPDPSNREQFERCVGAHPRVQLSAAAVSDTVAESALFFTSPISTGVSTLAAFHESHEPTAKVQVVTLAEDLRARRVQRVDFLKIDIEGFDYFALKGFDWTYAPRFVLYEFEDRKTVPLGYSLADSSAYAADRGYHLVYSVWEPIIEYGTRHRWRGLFSAPPSDVAMCWGNVLCFRDQADAARCVQRFGPRLRRLVSLRQHG